MPGTHFCLRLRRPQGHSETGRIISMKNSNNTIGNCTCGLLLCSAVTQPTAPLCTPVQNCKQMKCCHTWFSNGLHYQMLHSVQFWCYENFTTIYTVRRSGNLIMLNTVTSRLIYSLYHNWNTNSRDVIRSENTMAFLRVWKTMMFTVVDVMLRLFHKRTITITYLLTYSKEQRPS